LFWKKSALWLEKQESAKVRKQNRRAGRPPRGERPEGGLALVRPLYRGGRLRERPAPFLAERRGAPQRGREGGSAPPSGGRIRAVIPTFVLVS
jgi:hypothetical protein